jgi:hypothetical protein
MYNFFKFAAGWLTATRLEAALKHSKRRYDCSVKVVITQICCEFQKPILELDLVALFNLRLARILGYHILISPSL